MLWVENLYDTYGGRKKIRCSKYYYTEAYYLVPLNTHERFYVSLDVE